MSAGGTLFWAGIALVGVVLIAPNLGQVDKPQPATARSSQTTPPPAARRTSIGNGYASQELKRDSDGHFYVDAQVNGARVRFLVDTGASVVALTPADAQRAGIGLPSDRSWAIGASGEVEVIPVSIDRLAVGALSANNVRAAVAPSLPVSLLGQSFLSQVGAVEIRDDTMVLR
jgi:aspartyl protease family protein